MEDIKNMVLEVDDLFEKIKIDPNTKNIYDNIIQNIYYELEQLKFLLINNSKLPLNTQFSEFNEEINKRDRILRELFPIFMSKYFIET